MEKDKYIWHYDVHNRKFGETLLYLKLSFYPVYRRNNIFNEIEKFFKEKGIYSYCIYELYGLYDLMLCIWVPSKLQQIHNFWKELSERLQILNCTNVIPFLVDENIHHWPWWDNSRKKLLLPLQNDIDNLSNADIVEVNKGNQSKIDDLITKNILRKYEHKEGIKFFIVIPQPGLIEAPTSRSSGIILSRLKEMLTETEKILESSMYFGNGFAWILIKGMVAFIDYSMINELIQKINEVGVKLFYIHTYTYLVATDINSQYCIEKEEFPEEQEITVPFDIAYYLKKEEDEHFEVKGSLGFDVDRYVWDRAEGDFRNKKVVINRVLKSIVGFLNADGGEILIGALEKRRYGDVLKDPNHLLSKYPMIGNRIIFGINNEYYADKGWDGFVLRLTDLISSNISRDISVVPKKYEYEGRDLCLVKVPRGKKWNYLDKKEFWVRRANSTVLLEGSDIDNYKDLYPRGKKND